MDDPWVIHEYNDMIPLLLGETAIGDIFESMTGRMSPNASLAFGYQQIRLLELSCPANRYHYELTLFD